MINFINLYHNEIYYTEEDINSIITSLSINRLIINKNENYIEGISKTTFTNIFNINKKSSFSFTFSLKNISFLKTRDKNDILKTIIINTIEQEKKIEEAKTAIITRNDFDINKIISFFFNDKKDNIEYDFFLNKYNISLYLNYLEKELLFRRIDLNRKGFINKSELFDFFVPFKKKYRDNFEKKNK